MLYRKYEKKKKKKKNKKNKKKNKRKKEEKKKKNRKANNTALLQQFCRTLKSMAVTLRGTKIFQRTAASQKSVFSCLCDSGLCIRMPRLLHIFNRTIASHAKSRPVQVQIQQNTTITKQEQLEPM